jgi:bifunctional polynucleotide phosphatase/kinase
MAKRARTTKTTPAAKGSTGTSSGGWTKVGEMVWHNAGSEPSAKVLGFDMDSTLICTKSGKTFSVNADDWRLLYTQIPAVMKRYHD